MNFENNEKVQILVDRLITKAAARELSITSEIAEDEIEEALLEYYNDRHYTPTKDEPYEDIYAGIIVQLALSSISKAGAEGEVSHREGGVSRTYDSATNYPLKLTQKIVPLVKGVD